MKKRAKISSRCSFKMCRYPTHQDPLPPGKISCEHERGHEHSEPAEIERKFNNKTKRGMCRWEVDFPRPFQL